MKVAASCCWSDALINWSTTLEKHFALSINLGRVEASKQFEIILQREKHFRQLLIFQEWIPPANSAKGQGQNTHKLPLSVCRVQLGCEMLKFVTGGLEKAKQVQLIWEGSRRRPILSKTKMSAELLLVCRVGPEWTTSRWDQRNLFGCKAKHMSRTTSQHLQSTGVEV